MSDLTLVVFLINFSVMLDGGHGIAIQSVHVFDPHSSHFPTARWRAIASDATSNLRVIHSQCAARLPPGVGFSNKPGSVT